MATRSTIKVENETLCKVYKHWDGYPEGMMEWLTKFNQEFKATRGEDSVYKLAQLLRRSQVVFPEPETPEFTGWGIIPYDTDYGEKYEYTLMDNGTVTCRSVV